MEFFENNDIDKDIIGIFKFKLLRLVTDLFKIFKSNEFFNTVYTFKKL